ncbi:MAG: MarR family transcriptional regulator [Actinophytocola sp.]|uniref:MarR family winged helix-turn-helix transcriptional regulator n=1 Tax=Actinophytocola sp. TaxID=1872138 RepID=UPI001326B27A|nr:MarR family transcriptional regulator [Actinophytocola sp.]MPZ83842.1 MarR family transcriptional regulator [Actinophytocola sp.]
MANADQIDLMLDQWRRERPDLDLSALGTFGRLGQLTAVLLPAVERVFARHGLRGGEFDVLAALRRAGRPYTMIPSELSAVLMMSRAGMTNRLDRLEAAGLVDRRLDPADRRSFRIVLTDKGLETVDAALTEHAANIGRLISVLSEDERAALNRTLRVLQDAVGRPTA